MVKRTVVMVVTKDILKPYLDLRVFKEAKALVEQNFKVTVLCRVYSLNGVCTKENYKGVRVQRQLCIKPKKISGTRLQKLYYNLVNVRSMAKMIIELDPDIIHAHDLNALLECVLAKRKLNVPLIYDSHEDWPRLEQSTGNNLAYVSAMIYEKFLLAHVNYIVTVNRSLAERFRSIKPTLIIHNFPEAKTFTPKDEVEKEIYKKYDLRNKTIIEYHGVIGPNKGTDQLFAAAALLVKKHKDILFLLIGDTSENYLAKRPEHGLEDFVIFTGPVDYNLIPSYISVSDIGYLVLPPTTQYIISTPTKLFECMLLGKPVVANAEFPEVANVMGGPEKARPGLLVKYDVDEIVSALDRLIANRSLRKKYGDNGTARVLKSYTWEVEREKLIEFYEQL